MIGCVVFDMDDTLYEEVEYCKSGFQAVAGTLTKDQKPKYRQEIYDALWKEFISGNHTTTFNAALEQLGIAYDDKFIMQMVKTYRQHHPSISLPADSEMVLKTLKKRYKLALLTDGYLPAQRLKVQALGIEKYFQAIVYTEELGREYWKPSTRGFENILKELNTAAENCLYVGDNPTKDFIAPNKLGFKTIQVILPNRSHHGKAQSENAKADYVIKSIGELPALLKQAGE